MGFEVLSEIPAKVTRIRFNAMQSGLNYIVYSVKMSVYFNRTVSFNSRSTVLYVLKTVFILVLFNNGDRGNTVVKVLCYKSEGRWFDPSWCHWNFSLT